MDQPEKHNKRKFFWGLMGPMIFVTAGVISLALLREEDLPAWKSFSFSSFLPSMEIKEASAQIGAFQWRVRRVGAAQDVPQLPQVPLFEEEGLSLEEISPELDPDNDLKISVLLPPPPGSGMKKEPLEVRNPFMSLSPEEMLTLNPEESSLLDRFLESDSASDDGDSDECPWIEHKVARGERLVDISRKYKIFVATIMKANNISNPNRLALGQVLLIPKAEDLLEDVLEEQKSREEERLAAKETVIPIQYTKYVVRPGDSLWSIAVAHKLTVDSLSGTNILRNPDRLTVGTEIRIPNQDGLSVKAAAKQTIAMLAKKYNISEKAIRSANGLSPKASLKAGQEVFLPGASQVVSVYRVSSGGGGTSKKAPAVARVVKGEAGKFSWPLTGRITSPFGWRIHPIKRTRKFHTGIDIAAPRHTPVRATRSGQVIFAGWMSGYGRSVVIRHDGRFTSLYSHCQTLRVSKGQTVQRGTIIATVGSSGRATGPHCHFEIRQGERPTSPMSYLR